MLHPQIIHPQKLFPITLGPKEVRITLESTNNIVAINFGEDPFFLGPNPGSVRPGGLTYARIEEGFPVLTIVFLESGHIMLNVEEAAGAATVDDLVEGVGLGGVRGGVERDVLGGEAVVVEGGLAAGFFADVLIGGAAVFVGWLRGGVIGVG